MCIKTRAGPEGGEMGDFVRCMGKSVNRENSFPASLAKMFRWGCFVRYILAAVSAR
jgi:hypothetical protein